MVLGVSLWGKQADIVRSVASGSARVAVRSGHKIGKSLLLAVLALWWVAHPEARPGARVVMTSSSGRQVKSILWKELSKLYRRAVVRGYLLEAELHKSPEAGLQFPDGREVLGFSTSEPEKMAGFSGLWLLYILDEASGIPPAIFEAIEGNRAGGGRMVMCGNPTQTSGEFYEAFTTKNHLYQRHHISSRETPNATTGTLSIPGLATRDWCDEKRAEWGEEDPRYQVRVLGNFPSEADNTVFSLRLVEAAEARWAAANDNTDNDDKEPLELGVDPARFGVDSTVVCARRGKQVLGFWRLPKLDGPDTAGKVLELVRELRADEWEVATVRVDAIGIGAAVFDALRRHEDEVRAVAVISSKDAPTSEEYAKLRDQLWFEGAAWLKAGGALPVEPLLRAELVGVTYDFDNAGRVRVEPKAKTKKRIKRSPDTADAFLLAVFDVGAEYSSAVA